MDTSKEDILDTKLIAAYSQKVRIELIDNLIKDARISDDLDKTEVLLKALTDLDRTNLGLARVKIEEKKANDNGEVMDIVSGILKNVTMRNSPFINNNVDDDLDGLNERLSNYIIKEPDQVVEGELDRGLIEITYDSFMVENKD